MADENEPLSSSRRRQIRVVTLSLQARLLPITNTMFTFITSSFFSYRMFELLFLVPALVGLAAISLEIKATHSSLAPSILAALLIFASAYTLPILVTFFLEWVLLLLVGRFYASLRPPEVSFVNGKGKVALITGVSFNGIGYFMCRDLLRCGFTVVFVDFQEEAHLDTVKRALIEETSSEGRLEYLRANLLEATDCKNVVEKFRQKHSRLDLFVSNAGGSLPGVLPSGLSKGFMLCYASHFFLVRGLLDMLEAAPAGRLVLTASSSPNMLQKPFQLRYVMPHAKENSEFEFEQYARGKLCITALAVELQQRVKKRGSSLLVFCFHPGAVRSNVWQAAKPVLGPLFPLFFAIIKAVLRSPEDGAKIGSWLALAQDTSAMPGGELYYDFKVNKGNPLRFDPLLREQLLDFSEDLFKRHIALD